MAFDPSVIGSIADSNARPVDDMEKGVRLKDMYDREQMGKLQLDSAKTEAKEGAAVKEILKNSDYTTPEGLAATAAKVNRVSPRSAMDLLKTGQSYQSGEIQRQMDLYELADKRQGMIVSALDPIVAQARTMKNNGASDLDVNAYISQQMPGALQGLRSEKLADGHPALPDDQLKMVTGVAPTLAALEGWEAKSKQGQAQIKQRLDQFKADTQARGQDERARHDRGTEDAAAARLDLQERKDAEKKADAAKGLIDDDATNLAVGRLMNGENARDVLANFGRGKQGPENIARVQNAFAKAAKEQGVSPEEISARNVEFKGLVKEEQTAAAIAGKIRYAEKEIGVIGPKVLEASEKVPRGSFVPWNKLQNYSKEQLSDPDLKRLHAYLTTLTNSYDMLSARGGTDVDKRAHNRALLNDADSPAALKVAVDAIMAEGALSGEAASQSTKIDARDLPARQGNPPPAAAPPSGQSPPAAGGGAAAGGKGANDPLGIRG